MHGYASWAVAIRNACCRPSQTATHSTEFAMFASLMRRNLLRPLSLLTAIGLVAACARSTSTSSTSTGMGAGATISAARPVLPGAAGAASAVGGQSQRGMVVSASAIVSQAGRDVLAAGGNAIDAAIATGFALAVTYPTAGNIGGGGFMVIRMPDGRATTIDFRETAPAAATAEMFSDSSGAYSSRLHHRSHLSVGVPGTVAGFALAHQKYGRSAWKNLVDPAVKLAGDGFTVPSGLAASLSGSLTRFKTYPATEAAYSKAGVAYAVGERMRLPDLARTLIRIRDQGRDGFYRGETAKLIANEMKRGGGVITEADLAAYEAWVIARKKWYSDYGVREDRLRFYELTPQERPHYAKAGTDVEYLFPWGWGELESIAHRGTFDLDAHMTLSGKDLQFFDEASKSKYTPILIESSAGMDRTTLTMLVDAYDVETIKDEESGKESTRVVLRFHTKIAPVQVGVFPLARNKPDLVERARGIERDLRNVARTMYDEGNVGQLYRRQDEIGTPFCIMVDFRSLEDGTVTVRERDSMRQDRVEAASLRMYLAERL